jgi:uncharacterized membrane protein YkvA (DUF1232 family)
MNTKGCAMIRAIVDQVWLTWKLLFDKRVPTWMKAVALAPLIYVLSPIDIIPDFILGLGQLDDLGLILAGMRLFESIVPEYIVQEHRAFISQRSNGDMVEGKNYTVKKSNGAKAKP